MFDIEELQWYRIQHHTLLRWLFNGGFSYVVRTSEYLRTQARLYNIWKLSVCLQIVKNFSISGSVCLCTYFFTAIVTQPCKGRSVLKTKKEWIRCEGQSYLFMELRLIWLIHPQRLKLSVRWCPFHFSRVDPSDNQVQPLVKTLCDLSFSLRGKKISLNHTSVFSVSAPWMNCWDAAFLSASMFM